MSELCTLDEFRFLFTAFTSDRLKMQISDFTLQIYFNGFAAKLGSEQVGSAIAKIWEEWEYPNLPSVGKFKEAAGVSRQNAGAYQAFEPKDLPALPEVKLTDLEKLEQDKLKKQTLIAGVLLGKSGDLALRVNRYHSFLGQASSSYGELTSKLTGYAGAITHNDMMDFLERFPSGNPWPAPNAPNLARVTLPFNRAEFEQFDPAYRLGSSPTTPQPQAPQDPQPTPEAIAPAVSGLFPPGMDPNSLEVA